MAEDLFEISGTLVDGAFLVDRVVAEGGFSVVYRAHHVGFDAPIALKCLRIPPHLNARAKTQFRDLFQSEGRILFRLSTQVGGVVRPLHIDSTVAPNGAFMPYLALEWLEGETIDVWASRLRAGGDPRLPASLGDWVSVLDSVASTLAYAHQLPGSVGDAWIVHRDIKPQNLFVVGQQSEVQVKVLDFGIAKAKSALNRAEPEATASAGIRCFSPHYAAPEQWLPERFGPTGPWTDVWALALTLSRLSAGKTSPDGDELTHMGRAIDPHLRPTPRALGGSSSLVEDEVLLKALAIDPKERFANAGEFWEAMTKATAGAIQVGVQSAIKHHAGQVFFEPSEPHVGEAAHRLELDFGESAPSNHHNPSPSSGPNRSSGTPVSGHRDIGHGKGGGHTEAWRTTGPASKRVDAVAGIPGTSMDVSTGIENGTRIPLQPRAAARARAILRQHHLAVTGMVGAASLTFLGQWYATRQGEPFRWGPVSLTFVATSLALVAAASVGYGWWRIRKAPDETDLR